MFMSTDTFDQTEEALTRPFQNVGHFPFRDTPLVVGSQLLKYGDRIVKGIAAGIDWELANSRKIVRNIMIVYMMVQCWNLKRVHPRC